MFHFPFRAMGCQMRVLIDTSTDATSAATLVAESIQQWEQTLSRFDPQSELNALPGIVDRWQPVSPVLWDVLLAAAWAFQHTGGIIDPTIRPALEAQGYTVSYDDIAQPVLSHRLLLSTDAHLARMTPETVIADLVARVPVAAGP